MGLFGNGWQDKLSTIGATLGDVGGALNHTGGGNLRQLQAQRKMDAQEQARKAALAGLYGGMAPPMAQTPGITPPPQYGSAGEAAKGGYVPEVAAPQQQAPQAQGAPQFDPQALMRYIEAGGDPTPYLQMMKMQQRDYQGFNGTNGVTVFDPSTGQTRFVPSPQGPNADLDRAEMQAKIAYWKAQTGAKENQGDLYAAKAKQPYAPIRPRAGAAGGSSSRTVYGSAGEFGD